MGFWSGLASILGGTGALAATPFTGGATLPIAMGLLGGGGAIAGGLADWTRRGRGGLGDIAGGIGFGRARGRELETGYGFERDRNALQRFGLLQAALQRAQELAESGAFSRASLGEQGTMNRALLGERGAMDRATLLESGTVRRADLDLARREFALKAPAQRLSTGLRGDLAANVQDAQITGLLPGAHPRATVMNVEGGLRPSALSGTGRALGAEVARSALMDQLAGDRFAPVPDVFIPRATTVPGVNLPPMGDFTGSLLQAPEETPLPRAGMFDRILSGLQTGGDLASLFGGGQGRQPSIEERPIGAGLPQQTIPGLPPWVTTPFIPGQQVPQPTMASVIAALRRTPRSPAPAGFLSPRVQQQFGSLFAPTGGLF